MTIDLLNSLFGLKNNFTCGSKCVTEKKCVIKPEITLNFDNLQLHGLGHYKFNYHRSSLWALNSSDLQARQLALACTVAMAMDAGLI